MRRSPLKNKISVQTEPNYLPYLMLGNIGAEEFRAAECLINLSNNNTQRTNDYMIQRMIQDLSDVQQDPVPNILENEEINVIQRRTATPSTPVKTKNFNMLIQTLNKEAAGRVCNYQQMKLPAPHSLGKIEIIAHSSTTDK
ncbi:hypothetical protein AVEN_42013-1 [Araneus ventricosus]|uniref:Uncharacterized protein n=1 Tax=Araneus ventricosus TaxID=182803 RepID=A0A4Y2P2W8_ARAVE|nr:hypothetical protein AVEN_71267-1 [Araneus ventricosus]GBN45714.1 hypothetical protein AVEN_42013-1 [Araneus ventricosus]